MTGVQVCKTGKTSTLVGEKEIISAQVCKSGKCTDR